MRKALNDKFDSFMIASRQKNTEAVKVLREFYSEIIRLEYVLADTRRELRIERGESNGQ